MPPVMKCFGREIGSHCGRTVDVGEIWRKSGRHLRGFYDISVNYPVSTLEFAEYALSLACGVGLPGDEGKHKK